MILSLRNWEGVSAASLLERTEASAEVIPDGKGARLGMFSARFDRGPVEKKFRKVHEILLARNYNVLMVNVGPTEDFGTKTDEYLARLYKENGTLLAVCTDNYAEKTASNYSSFKELKFAHEQRLSILPLKISDTYPPEPPHGPTHPYDKNGEAFGLVRLAFHPSLVYLDCRALEPEQIAAKIAHQLHAKVGKAVILQCLARQAATRPRERRLAVYFSVRPDLQCIRACSVCFSHVGKEELPWRTDLIIPLRALLIFRRTCCGAAGNFLGWSCSCCSISYWKPRRRIAMT